MTDLRPSIQQALAVFGAASLPDAARGFFATLGYSSKRTLRIASVKQFCEHWDADGTLTAKERTSINRLTSLHFLFQLTDAELSTQTDLFTDPGTVDGTRIHSYLFLAAELPAGDYSRTDLTAIARALNKPLKMPALVLFKHGDCLSLAVLHRRLNKVASDRDVLEKATLIKDIRCAAPHRAHVEILADLAFDSLKAAHPVTSFVQLHAAWRDTLDIQELNKRFYRELQHWYFWALGHVRFPDGAPKDADDRDSLSLIRLLTRLIFVWFLKEKGLVPENLFDARALPKLLKGFAPANSKDKDSVYYRAVLQNLFFATLNCESDQRGWAREGQNMMAHSLYRFREDFASATTALDLFKDIPFLNGGLFECLDKDLGEGARPRYVRIDGFSRRDDSQPVVPDFLFFGPELDADLSDFYEDKKSGKKARPVRVRGLLEIFHDFKFTIEENTPLEEDVALDPELLGRVFENLLAAYNPETQVTARKQTGSFYTPREIVDYMTGQALFYALREKVSELPDLDTRLPAALAHDDAPNPFNSAETGQLITALDELKVLDPACGSGAFPMGVLHRLVHLLGKLDPGNTRWKKRQLDKAAELTDHDIRDLVTTDIEEAFAKNELGYGRKLYLIENCLYGVDIQPIAAQITKLRFFISLIVEQRTDPKAPNRGIRPLPNLETKIVAANTLIGIARPGQQMLRNFDIDAKEAELRHVRDDHFLARTPKKKSKCREEDARLRKVIASLLKDDGWDSATAKKLSAWDPYDQNAHADFFDNEWMFGLTEGFDVVIGNPPYVRIQTLTQADPEQAAWFKEHYASAGKGNYDLYVVFVERALELLSAGGHAAYILPHKFFNAQYGEPLRELIAKGKHLRHVVHFGDQQIFPGATNYVCLLFLSKEPADSCRWARTDDLPAWLQSFQAPETSVAAKSVTASDWNFAVGEGAGLFGKLQRMPVKLENVTTRIFQGIKTSADKIYIVEELGRTKKEVRIYSPEKDQEYRLEPDLLHPLIKGGDSRRYSLTLTDRLILFPYAKTSDGGSELISEAILKRDFPLTWTYLRDNKRYLENREDGKMKHDGWHGYIYPKALDVMPLPKLFTPDIAPDAAFSFDTSGKVFFTGGVAGGYGILPAEPYRAEFLLALLNSRLLDFLHHQIATQMRGGWYSYEARFIRQLPIRPIDFSKPTEKATHDTLVALVNQILAAKRADAGADTSAAEAEIDRHVYYLYGLTLDEIKIVEGSSASANP